MGRDHATKIDHLENPLLSESAGAWDELIESVGPASLLLIIESRMSRALRARTTAEDVFQESLLHAWRDRAQCEWRGLRGFRSWFMTIIDHRIQRAVEYDNAAKRKPEGAAVPFSVFQPSTAAAGGEHFAGPVASTTPSRLAILREEAEAMRSALDSLPEDSRTVLWLRVFEQLTVDEIAKRLEIGESAVRHRVRKAAELYESRVRAAFGSRTEMKHPENRDGSAANPSP